MRIVIEGPDGSGKTTLIERFMERYLQLRLMDRPCTSDGGPIEGLARWVEEDFGVQLPEFQGKWRLYDRHPMVSELIYSPALGRNLAEGFDDVNWLVNALTHFNNLNYMVIYCLPSKATVQHNVLSTHLQATEHVTGVVANLGRIYDLYHIRACVEHMQPYRFRWNYQTDEWLELAETFDRWLKGPR